MSILVFCIGLFVLFGWVIWDKYLDKKNGTSVSSGAPAPGDFWGIVSKRPLNQPDEQPTTSLNPSADTDPDKPKAIGRVYYSTPLRSYRGYIWQGRILKSK